MTAVETESPTRTRTIEQEQVERGAAWLDEHRPRWAEEINLAELKLNNCSHCVIGQLYDGDFFGTIQDLSVDEVSLGFFVQAEHPMFDDDAWDRLTEAWRDEIARRR
jgi:hypothetical protein